MQHRILFCQLLITCLIVTGCVTSTGTSGSTNTGQSEDLRAAKTAFANFVVARKHHQFDVAAKFCTDEFKRMHLDGDEESVSQHPELYQWELQDNRTVEEIVASLEGRLEGDMAFVWYPENPGLEIALVKQQGEWKCAGPQSLWKKQLSTGH